MVDLIDEIKEDLHRERLGNLWEQYGKWLLALAVAIVLATAGVTWWTGRMHDQQEALGKQYYDAMELLRQGKKKEASTLFEAIIKADTTAYPTLAAFKEAETLLDAGKTDEALAQYKSVAEATKTSPYLRDLAALLAINLEIASHKADSKTIEAELATLSRPDGVWHFSAQELQASYALEQGNTAKALELYTTLSRDLMTPHAMKERASEMVQALSSSGAK